MFNTKKQLIYGVIIKSIPCIQKKYTLLNTQQCSISTSLLTICESVNSSFESANLNIPAHASGITTPFLKENDLRTASTCTEAAQAQIWKNWGNSIWY